MDDGITHLRNLLLSIDLFLGSLLSTLDSLLFCIFIITPGQRKCKMGCSIKERRKVWKIRGFTGAFPYGMINMLGGFHKEAARFRLVGQVGLEPTMGNPADLQSAAIAARRLTRIYGIC